MTKWYDKRKGNHKNHPAPLTLPALSHHPLHTPHQKTAKDLDLSPDALGPSFKGFILNIPKTKYWLFKGRHWLTLKPIENVWYNLDAQLPEPKTFSRDSDLRKMLIEQLTNNDAELLIVTDEATTS